MSTDQSQIPTTSHLLDLPAELRLKIYSHLLNIPSLSTTSVPHRAVAYSQGFTSGVGHIALIQKETEWRSVSIAKPPGFACLGTSILQTCKLIHKEAIDVFYDKILWVINIQDVRSTAAPATELQSAIVASPDKASVFLQALKHIYIRQHIRPEEDLIVKAEILRSLFGYINPKRKSTQLSLHFESIHLINDSEWPRSGKIAYAWEAYAEALESLEIGKKPQIRVGYYWLELEGSGRFEQFAERIGGEVNQPDYIYW